MKNQLNILLDEITYNLLEDYAIQKGSTPNLLARSILKSLFTEEEEFEIVNYKEKIIPLKIKVKGKISKFPTLDWAWFGTFSIPNDLLDQLNIKKIQESAEYGIIFKNGKNGKIKFTQFSEEMENKCKIGFSGISSL